uniref:Protein kinase domain-containing protein n=1 Tax=Solanum tuberosum TaxID=4113 RepID=M1DRH6_SOLTU
MKLKITSTPASVKPNAAAIPEGEETKGANLDNSFQFSKQFASEYEIGEEMGRGHFGYTCSAIVKIGELKGQKVVVKELMTLGLLEWNKSRVTTEIPKYGKKVPKNTISVVAGFTAVYWAFDIHCVVPLVRTEVPETVIDVLSEEYVTQQLEVEYEKEFEDESEEEFEDEFEKECEDGSENEYEDDSEDESKDEFEDDTP